MSLHKFTKNINPTPHTFPQIKLRLRIHNPQSPPRDLLGHLVWFAVFVPALLSPPPASMSCVIYLQLLTPLGVLPTPTGCSASAGHPLGWHTIYIYNSHIMLNFWKGQLRAYFTHHTAGVEAWNWEGNNDLFNVWGQFYTLHNLVNRYLCKWAECLMKKVEESVRRR